MNNLSELPPLDDGILDPDPVKQFNEWYAEAVKCGLKLPNAMSLATATSKGVPSVRVVLLKGFDDRGVQFYTNYESRKAEELSENPHAALVIYWADLDRSVRIEGPVLKISRKESEKYFATRPRESQLSSWTSLQSKTVENRDALDRRYEELEKQYNGKEIPCPENWGGYRLEPSSIEFWQQRFARLNDRILYRLQDDGSWVISRLSP